MTQPPDIFVPDDAGGFVTAAEKAADLERLSRSVVDFREGDTAPSGVPSAASFIIWAVAQSTGIIQWGKEPKRRDRQLREFIPQENFLASAISTVSARNAALSWTIKGDAETAVASREMVANANFGAGWEDFIIQTSLDIYAADTGAFVEMVRSADSPTSPVVGFNHLDSLRCYPTGIPETPMVYQDRQNRWHVMKWYQVVQLLEMPAPGTPDNQGFFWRMQLSAVTRLLKAAQILLNVSTYTEEKTGGRQQRAIHLVRGVSAQEIEDAFSRAMTIADSQGLQQYMNPAIISPIDAEVDIGHEVVELAALPDGFDEDKLMKNYILALSMAFLTDYQEFAPLPGGNLGTSEQSATLHMKSRGKGLGLFQKLITRLMNEHGILPANVEFAFDDPDPDAEQQAAETAKIRADERSVRVQSGELLQEEARQIAMDAGDLPRELFEAGGAVDATPAVTVEDTEQTGQRELAMVTGAEDDEWRYIWDGLAAGRRAVEDTDPRRRAGPDEERLEFEDEIATDIHRGLAAMVRDVRKRLREGAASDG